MCDGDGGVLVQPSWPNKDQVRLKHIRLKFRQLILWQDEVVVPLQIGWGQKPHAGWQGCTQLAGECLKLRSSPLPLGIR